MRGHGSLTLISVLNVRFGRGLDAGIRVLGDSAAKVFMLVQLEQRMRERSVCDIRWRRDRMSGRCTKPSEHGA